MASRPAMVFSAYGACLRALAVAWLLVAAGIPFAGAESPYPPDIRRIVDRGELVVAMHREDLEPFFATRPDGTVTGLDAALAEAVAAALGVRLRFDRTAATYEGVVDRVAAGHADIAISCLSRTPRRAMRVRFSDPYVRLRLVLLVNRLKVAPMLRGGTDPRALDQPGVRVGLLGESAYQDFARRALPEATVATYPDEASAVLDVYDGAVHLVLTDQTTAAIVNRDRGAGQRKDIVDWSIRVQTIALDDEHGDPIAMATNLYDQHLSAWLAVWLETAREDGSLGRLVARHLGEARP